MNRQELLKLFQTPCSGDGKTYKCVLSKNSGCYGWSSDLCMAHEEVVAKILASVTMWIPLAQLAEHHKSEQIVLGVTGEKPFFWTNGNPEEARKRDRSTHFLPVSSLPPVPVEPSIDKERRTFEAFAKSRGWDVQRPYLSTYTSIQTQARWEAWLERSSYDTKK